VGQEVAKEVVMLPIGRIRPSRKNFFRPPGEEEVRELADSISRHGVIDPIAVRLVGEGEYEIISGHSRFKALELLGWEKVPCLVYEADDVEAELMLIDANLQSRNLSPMEIARAIRRKKELLGERRGRPEKERHNVADFEGKTSELIGAQIGLTGRQVERYDKLNDLIPPLQDLVSRGKLAQTAAYSLAFLPPEEQRRLLDVLGESGVCGLSVQEAQELRRQLDAERKRSADVEARLRDLERQLAQAQEGAREAESLRAELARLREENEQLKARGSEVVEKIVERVVVRPDPAQEAEIARLREEVARLQACLAEAERDRRGEGELREIERQLEEKREELRRLESELSVLEDHLQSRRATVGLLVMLRKLFAPLEKARVEVGERLRTTEFGPLHHLEIQEWIALLEWYLRRLQDLLNVRTSHVIDIAQYRGDCQG